MIQIRQKHNPLQGRFCAVALLIKLNPPQNNVFLQSSLSLACYSCRPSRSLASRCSFLR